MRWSPCLVRSDPRDGSPAEVRLGDPLVDEYLEFVAARCRPNTVLATAYDLKVFFEVVGKGAGASVHGGRVHLHRRAACTRRWSVSLGLRTARRGSPRARSSDGLASMSGLFGYLMALRMWRCGQPGAARGGDAHPHGGLRGVPLFVRRGPCRRVLDAG